MAIVETDLVQQPATGGARDVMMVIAVNADGTPISGGGGVAATWDTIEGKPEFVGAGDTAAAARTAIGAGTGNGTSNLAVGATVPSAAGVAAAGTSAQAARADHVHPLQTTVSGNAGTATTLATPRAIGVAFGATSTTPTFNGSAAVNISIARGAAVIDATDEADVVAQFNSLLASLRTAGIIAT